MLTDEQFQALVDLVRHPLRQQRLSDLAARANEGTLTQFERQEYEAYIDANNRLAIATAERRGTKE